MLPASSRQNSRKKALNSFIVPIIDIDVTGIERVKNKQEKYIFMPADKHAEIMQKNGC